MEFLGFVNYVLFMGIFIGIYVFFVLGFNI